MASYRPRRDASRPRHDPAAQRYQGAALFVPSPGMRSPDGLANAVRLWAGDGGDREGETCGPAHSALRDEPFDQTLIIAHGWTKAMSTLSRSRRRDTPWAMLCLVVSLGSAPAAHGETYAFLVGVSEYESKGELKALRFASDDVIAFAGVLRNSGVPAKNIVVMHDRQSNPRFKPAVKKILREFHLLLATLEPEDSLIVALAGHGVEVGSAGDSYFLPADADLKDPATLINIKTIKEQIEQSQAGRKLLLVDACRNDPEADNARGLGVLIKPPRRISEDSLPKGLAALFSCNSEQRSFEDPLLRHGIFFYQVIKAWEGAADFDRDGRITLEELESFVRRETKTHARDALSTVQTPVFRGDR